MADKGQNIPSRIRYYLLDYRDRNMDEYMELYGETRLKDLTPEQLKQYFSIAHSNDLKFIK